MSERLCLLSLSLTFVASFSALGCGDDSDADARTTDLGSEADSGEPDSGDAPDEASSQGLVFPAELIFGAASAAHQIEGNNTNNNWYQFETLAQYEGATTEPSGLAVNGYELWQSDNALVEQTNLDAYRFSIEWSRIQPRRGDFDADEIAHYRAILEDLSERGIRPFVTLHHFTDPIWLNDLSDLACEGGPSDDNLCGWTNPDAVAAFEGFARRMAQEYGDLVDDWSTFNEPNTYTHVGYFLQQFPPGHPESAIPEFPNDDRWIDDTAPVARALVEAHALAYDAIRESDTIDADDDGVAASVGWTIAAQFTDGADPENPADDAGAEIYRRWINFVYPDAVATGDWDADLDGTPEETNPSWVGRQDFIGVQYYSRVFVLGDGPGIPSILGGLPCFFIIANVLPRCPEVDENNLSFVNEVYPEGLYDVVQQFAERYPDLPLPITENGAAAENGERKAQILVRHLMQVHRLIEDGYPVSAYYAWSLTDNFEWADGFEPRFGLWRVNYETFERTATRAQEVYSEIAGSGVLSDTLIEELGSGPLLPDE